MSDSARRATLLSISSGKGGVGKTSVTVNLGYALSRLDRRVLVVDGDLGLSNVDILLNLQVDTRVDDVLHSDSDPMDAVVEVSERFYVLPASSGVADLATIGPAEQEAFEKVIDSLASRFDIVLADTGAGIGRVVQWLNAISDCSVIVLTPEPTSITDAYALVKVLHSELERDPLHLIVNGVAGDEEGERLFQGVASVSQRFLDFRPHLLGLLPRDEVVTRAVHEKCLVMAKYPESPFAKAIERLAASVVDLSAKTAARRQPSKKPKKEPEAEKDVDLETSH